MFESLGTEVVRWTGLFLANFKLGVGLRYCHGASAAAAQVQRAMTRHLPQAAQSGPETDFDEDWNLDLSVDEVPAPSQRSKIVRMNTTQEIDPSVPAELHRVTSPRPERDPEPGAVLASMRGFGVESGHVHRVDKLLTESVECAIARTTVSGTSEIEDARPGASGTMGLPAATSTSSLRIAAILVVVALLAALGVLVWVFVTGGTEVHTPAAPPTIAEDGP